MGNYTVKRKIRFTKKLGKRVGNESKEFVIFGDLDNFGSAIDDFKEQEFGGQKDKWVITQSTELEDINK